MSRKDRDYIRKLAHGSRRAGLQIYKTDSESFDLSNKPQLILNRAYIKELGKLRLYGNEKVPVLDCGSLWHSRGISAKAFERKRYRLFTLVRCASVQKGVERLLFFTQCQLLRPIYMRPLHW